jgi:DNA polymerase-3 subunit epsilon
VLAPAVAFVDLETTGTRAAVDRVTEIGIVRVDCDGGGAPPRVEEWSTLVDPEVPIPPEIQALTGITDAMVRGAPTFSSIASDVEQRLAGCVFVAHNARFDFGFLKHEFARLDRTFAAKVLCTVRLSRRLFPDEQGHGLDAIIARHGLEVADRHRALGDARALWAFTQAIYRCVDHEHIDAAIRRLLRIPSLPPHLPPDALDAIPSAPGVYLFYGLNALPLYVGKSLDLRERVAAHFTSDWARETDLRLSQEIRRIEFETTAGEFGALLREATLVKERLPAHNHALRRKADAGVMRLDDDGRPCYLPAEGIDPSDLDGAFGPFSSKRGMREALREAAAAHGLCWTRLGLERRSGPCFARQLQRCRGACDGGESTESHDERLREALLPREIPRWPFTGPALIREQSLDGTRVEVHVVHRWQWLGTASDDAALDEILTAPPRPAFDLDVTRLLLRTWAREPERFVPVPQASGFEAEPRTST